MPDTYPNGGAAQQTTAPLTFGPLPDRPTTTPRSARAAQLADQAAQLAARPGEWARLGTYHHQVTAAGMARRIRTGETAAFRPAGAYEAVSRGVDGEYGVWARYVGGES